MCVPCCDEYKKYGETKRARWKFKCEQLEKKLAALRKAEDARPEFQLRNRCHTGPFAQLQTTPRP